MVAAPSDAEGAVAACGPDVEVRALPIDDAWMRDSGPIIVRAPDATRHAVHFRFNVWGEKYAPYDQDAAIGARVARACKRTDSGGAVAAEHPNGHRETHGRRTAEAEQREPAGPTIAPRAEGMHERNGPSGVGEKVDDPPGAVADPRAHEARYDEREQEIERHGSEAQPDRPVR